MGRSLATVVAVLSVAPAPSASAALMVNVRLIEKGAIFSPTSAVVGPVRFSIENRRGQTSAFVIANRRTRDLMPRQRAKLDVRFRQARTYRYVVMSGKVRRRGTFRVVDSPPVASKPTLTKLGDFASATDIDAPLGDPDRVVVAEQRGMVSLLVNGVVADAPFLDLTDRVRSDGENGLLGIAIAPDYVESGRLYVFYNDLAANINIVEFRRDPNDASRIDPNSGRTIFRQIKFAPNHNGGMLQFGPDGALYASIGDGGSTPDIKPGAFAQSPDAAWGKVLRIDPVTGKYDIVARGLRNPWRFWIDAARGEMFIADVGQDQREEVNIVPLDAAGANLGWPCYEGSLQFDPAEICEMPIAPAYEYGHSEQACSIIGGVVVRDPLLPTLVGAYLFGDLCGRGLHALQRTASGTNVTELAVPIEGVIAFGVDGRERVYVSAASGGVYRLDPPAAATGSTVAR